MSAIPYRLQNRSIATACGGLALALLLSSASARAENAVVIASPEDGAVPVVVPEDAPYWTRDAAETLVAAIERISGRRPELLQGVPDPLPPRAIWVGYQRPLDELFPDLDFDFTHPEEILTSAADGHVVLVGRDRWHPEHPTVPGRTGKPIPKQSEYGTANAVYTFMQDQLGVRWLWPGESGEDYPRRERLEVAPPAHRYHPAIRSRGGVFHFSSLLNDRGYGKSHRWTRLQRLQLDSLQMDGGHGFADWWDRYYKTEPELFALQPDGTRGTYPNPRTMKLCMSNPRVWQLWLEDVQAQLQRDRMRTVFNASPNDGWYSGHCICDNCTAWDHPDGEPRLFLWQGHREQRPALSDRDVTFANRLGELLKKRYPDADYKVMMLSYGHSRPAPIAARPADNVIMSIVANFFGRSGLVDRGSTRGDTYRQQFDAWAELGVPLLWRPNTGSPAGWQQGLPDLHLRQTAEDLKHVAAAGCQGIYIDSVWEHWATQGPQYYVMAQLVWNPSVDVDAILDDYYRRGFGAAAEPVREYFELWEQARELHVAEHSEAGVFYLPLMYTPERLAEAEQLLERAAAAVADEARYSERVAFVAVGLSSTRLLVENIRQMRDYWIEPDEAVAERVRANWDEIERLVQPHIPAINWGAIRPSTPRMSGLHPDHPNPKLKLRRRQLEELDLY